MKYVSLAILSAAAGWYYCIDGSRLDEQMVRAFYEEQARRTYEREPQALCDLYGRALSLKLEARISGRTHSLLLDKEQACRQLQQSFKFFEEIGDQAGGVLTMEYNYDIQELTFADDRKSAVVRVSAVLKMGEEFMQIFTTSTDRIERSLRKIRLVKSEAVQRMRWTPGAITEPEKYFVER